MLPDYTNAPVQVKTSFHPMDYQEHGEESVILNPVPRVLKVTVNILKTNLQSIILRGLKKRNTHMCFTFRMPH